MYQKFNDFIVFDPPDVSDYIVGYRELGGEFRSTIQSLTDVVKKYAIPLTPSTIFVNISGNDSSIGNSEAFAFRTIKRAMAKALEISRNLPTSSLQFEDANGWGTAPNPVNVFVRAGDYVEDNPIYVPPGVTIVGENVKSVSIIPKNKFYDIFWVNNKTSVQNITFKDYFHPAYAIAFPELKQLKNEQVVGQPSTRIVEATAKAYEYFNKDYNKYPSTKISKSSFLNFNIDAGDPIFDPFNIAFLGRYFKNFDQNETFFTSEELSKQIEFWESEYFNLSSGVEKPYIFNSPYIYNCYSATLEMSANKYDAGATVYVDGNMVDGPLRSMHINSCEHFNQGGNGVHVNNDGFAFIKDNLTTCCTQAILASNGGTCVVDDSVCSFGLSGLVSIGRSLKPIMVGILKNDFNNTETSNSFVITNLGSEYSKERQEHVDLYKPYVGQVFEILDKNYLMPSTEIKYLTATNSGTYFVVQSASNLRPASPPYEGYECDVIFENLYSISNDSSITENTFTPPVDKINAESDVLFYTRSSILAYSHVFDNVGTGTNYLSATIQSGAIGNEKLETNKDKVGVIIYNSQNQSGFTKFGDNVKINQINGKIDSKTLFTENTITNTLTSYNDINFGSFRYIDQNGGNRPLLNITRNSDDKIISIESINDNGQGNNVRSFYARGNTSTKKALSANDDVFRITGFAHNGVNYPNYGFGGNTSIRFHAAGDQSSTNAGGYISLWTTKMDTISTTSERMRIADSGYVGINTTNPLSTLHVQGNVLVSDNISVIGDSTFTNMSVNSITALSAYFDVLNIKQYEISGFDVKGDFQIDGNTGFGSEPDSENRLTIVGNVSSVGDFNIRGNINLSNKLSSDQSYFNYSKIINLNNLSLSSHSLSGDYSFFSNSIINELSSYSLSSYEGKFNSLDTSYLNVINAVFNNAVFDNTYINYLNNASLSSHSLTADYLFSNNSIINELSAYSLSSYQAKFDLLNSLYLNVDNTVLNNAYINYLNNLSLSSHSLSGDYSFFSNSIINELSSYSLSSYEGKFNSLNSLYLNVDNTVLNNAYINYLNNASLSSHSLTADYLFSNNSIINELSAYSLSSYQAKFDLFNALSSYADYLFVDYITNNKLETLNLSALSANIYEAYVEKLSTNEFYANNLNVYGMYLNYLSVLSADIRNTSSFNVSGIIYTDRGHSSNWNSAYLTVSALSALWSDDSGDVSKLYVDSKFQTISGNTYTKNLTVSLPDGKTFGRYVDGEEIPAIGKTPYDIISMAIVEPIPPIVNLTSPTVVQFNQTSISNVLNYNYTIKSLGASVASLSLEYRRNNSGAWAVLGTATNTPSSFTHTLTDTNFNTQQFNYRLIVTDTVGGTKTTSLSVIPQAYVAPTITTPSLSGNVVSPETNTAREKGNVDTNISGNITRNSTYVNLLSSQLQYQVNGTGSWLDVDLPTNTPDASYSIPWTNHNPTGSNNANSIGYRVKVTDDYTISYSNVATINFYNMIFYGSSLNAPANSNEVRALPRKIFTNGLNPFNLETGLVNTNFTVAMPSSLSITQVIDLDALNLNITTSYILNGSLNQIQDYAGNNASYKVYTMTNSLPYTDKPAPGHRHQITRG